MSHARDFGQESGNDDIAQQLALDYRHATLSVEDRALCDYAVRLTLAPGRMSENDIVLLRECGVTDAEITVATQVIAYFNYITRVAQGLGADPEPWMDMDRGEWRQRKGRGYV
jgi:uncharacterized peroxidase-related enzyme